MADANARIQNLLSEGAQHFFLFIVILSLVDEGRESKCYDKTPSSERQRNAIKWAPYGYM